MDIKNSKSENKNKQLMDIKDSKEKLELEKRFNALSLTQKDKFEDKFELLEKGKEIYFVEDKKLKFMGEIINVNKRKKIICIKYTGFLINYFYDKNKYSEDGDFSSPENENKKIFVSFAEFKNKIK